MPVDNWGRLCAGLVLKDRVLFRKHFFRDQLTQELSLEQKLMMCDNSLRKLYCTGRKLGKTIDLEAEEIQTGLLHHSMGDGVDEALMWTPNDVHMVPFVDRIFSRLERNPILAGCVREKRRGENTIVEFRGGLRWYHRIEGTCVSGDTRIYDGATGEPVTIRELFDVGDQRPILVVGSNQEVVSTDQYEVYELGPLDTKVVTLADGHSLRATPEHRFMTQSGWKELKDLNRGDFVMVPGRFTSHVPDSGLPWRLTMAEARLLGYIAGDGGVTGRCVRFTNGDPLVIDDFAAICLEYGCSLTPDGKYSYAVSGGYDRWHPNPLTEFARSHLELWGKHSHEKRVPKAVFEAPDFVVQEYLAAYWNCDGSIYLSPNKSGYIECCTTSRGMVEDIYALMLRLGIRGRIIHRPARTNGMAGQRDWVSREHWLWRTGSAQDVLRFRSLIHCNGDKQARVDRVADAVINRPRAFKDGTIPWEFVREQVDKLWHGTSYALQKASGITFYPKQSYKGVSRAKAKAIGEFIGSEAIANLCDGDVEFSEVVGITDGIKEHVYDIRVPEFENYIANGMVVHNTGTDKNVVGLRAVMLMGDEQAFGQEAIYKSLIQTALPGARWVMAGVPNGVRRSPFYKLDQTKLGESWSRHKYSTYINPIYSDPATKAQLIDDYGGINTHGYKTQVLGEWGDEMFTSFPPGAISIGDQVFFDRTLEDLDRDDLDILPLKVGVGSKRCKRFVLSLDYGFSPDPSILYGFYSDDDDARIWRQFLRIKMVRVPQPFQIAVILHVMKVVFNGQFMGFASDNLATVQSLKEKVNPELSELVIHASPGSSTSFDTTVIRDEEPDLYRIIPDSERDKESVNIHNKQLWTEWLRSWMINATQKLEAIQLYLANIPEVIGELAGTTEKKGERGGYIVYHGPADPNDSRRQIDHDTDAARILAFIIHNAIKKRDIQFSEDELLKNMGWAGAVVEGQSWHAPWDTPNA